MADPTPTPLTPEQCDRIIIAAFEPDDDCAHNLAPLYAEVADMMAAARAAAWDEALRWVRAQADVTSPDYVLDRINRAEPFNPYRKPRCCTEHDDCHLPGEMVCCDACPDRAAALTTGADRPERLFYVDARTGEPCPTDGPLLCTVTDWKNHLHRDGRPSRG